MGQDGTILATADGGETWTPQVSGTNAALFDVDFVDATTGWAAGDGGGVLRTTDGGHTWTRFPLNSGARVTGLDFVDASHGWVVGKTFGPMGLSDEEVIRATSDGGQTWRRQHVAFGNGLFGVSFVDRDRGLAIGADLGEFIVYRTVDGGDNWERVPDAPSENLLQTVLLLNESEALVGSFGGRIYRTTDFGSNWSLAADLEKPVKSLTLSEGTVFATGFDSLLASSVDGGVSWEREVVVDKHALFAIAGMSAGRALSVGRDGVAMTLDTSIPGETVRIPSTPQRPPLPPRTERTIYPEEPGDPYLQHQWAPRKIQSTQAWQELHATGFGIDVAVLDSGVDLDHEDLYCPSKLRIVAGADFVGDGEGADDNNGHGTHVAGIISACTENETGTIGVAPDATIMPYQVCRVDGGCPIAAIVNAIRDAADNGAHVINLSLGAGIPLSAASPVREHTNDVDEAIEYAVSQGAVVVAAAGNDAFPYCTSPAISEDAICVGATDAGDDLASYSSHADKVDPTKPAYALVAPGGDVAPGCPNYEEYIVSLYPPELGSCDEPGYYDEIGTSMAAPHVSGVAALLYDRLGGVRSAEAVELIRNALLSTTDDLGEPGYDRVYGWGRVNALRAVRAVDTYAEATKLQFSQGSASQGRYTDEVSIAARLSGEMQQPIPGQEVMFELINSGGTRTWTAQTGDDGVAGVTMDLKDLPGFYTLRATYKGWPDVYVGSMVDTDFETLKEMTVTVIEIEGQGQSRHFLVATLTDDDFSHGVADRSISFSADDLFLGTDTTDEKGIAVLEIPPGFRGVRHTYEARFDGNEFYEPSGAQISD